MPNQASKQALVKFLQRVKSVGHGQLQLDLGLEVVEDSGTPKLRVTDDGDLSGLTDEPIRVRVPGDADSNGWIAEAVWEDDDTLNLGSVRRIQSDSGSLEHSRSEYRVAVPPSSVAALYRKERNERVSVEPVDISRGGLGVRADEDLKLEAGERVDVDLNIIGEFAGTLSGRVAFARENPDRHQIRIGISFDDLERPVAEALDEALNNILLGTTQEIT